jgi:hypothetical protein
MPTLSLNIIPFAAVQKALEAAEAADQETNKFNTHFHTHAEIAATIPEPENNPNKHVYPDLSASSQGFHEWHEIYPLYVASPGAARSERSLGANRQGHQ